MTDREKPSTHGKILGEALALISMAGRKDAPFELPECCLTCAFREGCMTNQMAATGKIALDCVLGIDKDRFGCHHGLKDGEPSKLCVGYIAARLAPWSTVKKILFVLNKDLDAMDHNADEVRTAFDVWLKEIDPENKLDDYQLARLFAKQQEETQ